MTTTAIVLAGGDGTRLRPLTRRLAGDDRPKQFCALLGRETLLEQTRRRAARLVAPERTLLSVTRTHEPYYRSALAGVPSRNVVAQPANRGTAPAILYALMRLSALEPTEAVVLLPSDHYVSDDDALMARVEGAVEAVRARPEIVVLLGIEPDRPEPEYGWIEPAEVILGRWANSFVIVANPSLLEQRIRGALPTLAAAFEPLRARVGTVWEDEAARGVYGRLGTTDFSRGVLQSRPEGLAVLPVSGIAWNDLGDPARVLATQRDVIGALVTA